MYFHNLLKYDRYKTVKKRSVTGKLKVLKGNTDYHENLHVLLSTLAATTETNFVSIAFFEKLNII